MLHIQKPVPSISFPFSVLSAKYPWNSKKKQASAQTFLVYHPTKKAEKKRAKCKPERFSVIQTPRGQAVVLCDTLWRRECGPILLIMKIWHTILILMNVVMMMMMMMRRRRRIRLIRMRMGMILLMMVTFHEWIFGVSHCPFPSFTAPKKNIPSHRISRSRLKISTNSSMATGHTPMGVTHPALPGRKIATSFS